MKTIICYSNRSSTTGKALRQKFRALRKRTDKKAKCDLFIRWGSTETFTRTRSAIELNTAAAVKNTVNKLAMLEILAASQIPVPEFNNTTEEVANHVNRDGMMYIRNKNGVVRYGNDFNVATDSYYTKPIQFKRREYRVHVFNGKVIGIYEKVPMGEERPKLFKSDTCNFVRCNIENCRMTIENQDTCMKAVRALGLVFGGVDVIRTKDGRIFICEVNSSPGLNTPMLDKYTQCINEYYESLQD